MKKYIFILLIITLSINLLQAQVNREVEVTKAYIPTVEKASKPMLKAFITDTAYINPDVDYSITPLSINTPLQTQPIKPATVTYWEFNRPAKAQVKIGAGLPLNSLLEAYVATHNASVGYLAANINHIGNYSDIENINGEMINAIQALNSGEVAGGLYFGDKTLAANISYDNDWYSRYAYVQSQSPLINYQNIGSAISFGDDFVDLSKLNYNVDVGFDHFLDRAENIDNSLRFGLNIGQSISLGNIVFSGDYERIASNYSYNNSSLSAAVMLNSKVADWQLDLGVKYLYDKSVIAGNEMPHTYLLPHLHIKRATPTMLTPFVEISGSSQQNNFASLTTENPYLLSGKSVESGVEYDLRGGIMGQNRSATFMYKLSAAYNIGINSRYWALCIVDESDTTTTDIYSSYFDVEVANLNTTSLNLYLGYRPFTNLLLSFDGSIYSYNESKYCDYINSKPRYEMSLGVDYTLRKFRMGVKSRLLGDRQFTICNYSPLSIVSRPTSSIDLGPVLDLGVYVDWKYSEKLSIFAEGSNLCNSGLYPFPHYRGYGAQFTVGAKFNFR